MKNKLYLIVCIGTAFAACNTTDVPQDVLAEADAPEAVLRSAPFSRGVNFSEWFEAFSPQGIQFTRFVEQDFADVKSLGTDVIRLPIRMHSMTGGPPNYTFDPLLLKFLDSAVDWAEKHELYLILDNHSFDPEADTDPDIDKILIPVWTQIAERYKNRSDYVVYEVLNEPHGISDQRWGEIQGKAIDAIRKIDQKHAIMVGGAEWNSIGKLSAIPKYDDDNLIYTFHFYDPFLFTHQGASWGEPLLVHLEGVPFPADKKRMPKIPAPLRGTWIESSLRDSYGKDAASSKLYSTLDKAVAFSKERNVPVFCGEFGVYMIQSPPEDRATWYGVVANALNKRKIAWTSWDYFGGFGIFDGSGGRDFNANLNTAVVRAMGFTPPPQRTQPPGPYTAGFDIFMDYPTREHTIGYWGQDTVFNMYAAPAAEGEYAIRWGNAERYNVFWIGFGNGDFSYLVEAGYILEFKARAETPVRFDVRFVNPDNAASIPWRIRYSVDEKVLPPDGQWHTIRIPLKDMQEHGAWVNATQQWLTPEGKFSWENVKQLEFVTEDEDLKNRYVWFDSIKITGP